MYIQGTVFLLYQTKYILAFLFSRKHCDRWLV